MRLRAIPDASFVALTDDGKITCLPDARGAHAVWFECPCGQHTNMIAFEPCIDTIPTTLCGLSSSGGRWKRAGDTLDDLTLTPSIAVKSKAGEPGECWHGFITAGEVTG